MQRVRNFTIIILLCIACFVVNLGLMEPDLMESRNFITAREMIQNDHWIVTTMNNELRLEKQPLVTWLTAVSALCGNSLTNNFLLRLPAAIIATFMVLFFYGICLELTKRDDFALLGSIVFATSLLVIQMARINSWDIFTHAFMTGSIWLQLRAFNKTDRNNIIWLFAAILMGLSIFSKGPVSVYALWIPFLISYYIFDDRIQIRKNLKKLGLMLLLALAIGLSWYIYLYIEIPDDLSRTLSKETTSRGTRHVHPFYFYFHFPVYIGIWAIPLLAALFFKPMRKRIAEFGNYRFLLCWILLGLFLLSVIPEKKERYMLPLEVPMCLMVTYLLYSIYDKFKIGFINASDKLMIKIHGWILVLLLVALPVVSFVIIQNDFFEFKYILATLISLIAGILLIRELSRLNNIKSFNTILISTVVVVVLITIIYLPVVPRKVYNATFKDIAEVKQLDEYNRAQFISAGELNMQLIWKIGKPVTPVVDLKNYNFKESNQYLIFGYTPIENIFSEQQLNQMKINPVGIFNCNRDKGDCKIYVNLIQQKI